VFFLIVFTTTYAFVYYNDGLNKNNRKINDNQNIQIKHDVLRG